MEKPSKPEVGQRWKMNKTEWTICAFDPEDLFVSWQTDDGFKAGFPWAAIRRSCKFLGYAAGPMAANAKGLPVACLACGGDLGDYVFACPSCSATSDQKEAAVKLWSEWRKGARNFPRHASPPPAAPVPWPEPAVGSKWDRYHNGKFTYARILGAIEQVRHATFVRFDDGNDADLTWFAREYRGITEYIPHGWDYATKQPKGDAPPVAVPEAKRPATVDDPAIECSMCGMGGLRAGGTHVCKPAPRIVGTYNGSDLAHDRAVAPTMRARHLTTDRPIEPGFGVEPSTKYPISTDPEQDIPNEWEW